MKRHLFGIIISSIFVSLGFVVLFDDDFWSLFFYVWPIVFICAAVLTILLLPPVIFLSDFLEVPWLLCCAFMIGGTATLVVVFLFFHFVPAWNVITIYYFIFGGISGVVSYGTNLIVNKNICGMSL
ncbi:hypothetical protein [Paracidovorax sp. MALMAid1276]|uniref:hypothetical protein n=1 Tax=Paracidovorax sp. MALMAid1276 TaxID=3411631 RepID=UPI003B9AF510